MKINTKKITSLALATIIAIGSTSAYAANFKDVTKGHWATEYIKKGNDLGLIKGYEDGSFKPEKSIARIEAISLAARTMNLPQGEIDKAVEKHKKTILDKGFDAWTVPDLSVALSQGIINPNILNELRNSNGAFSLSSREEAVIYMAKAMGLEDEVKKLDSSIKLPFIDAGKINKSAFGYVYLLHKHEIVRGDGNRYFNPQDPINRASMSVIVSSAYDFIEEQKKTDNDDTKPEPEKPVEKEYISGEISRTFSILGDNHIVIATSSGEIINYKIDDKSELKLDGKVISYNDLIEGLKVKITVSQGEDIQNLTIKTLEAENKVERIDGTIYDLEDATNKSITIEHQENGVSKKRTINLNDKTRIFLDKKEAKFSDLRKQDRIKIRVINNVIDEMEVESYIRQVEGVLKNVDTDSKYIDIKTEDGTEVRYVLGRNPEIIRNKKASSLNELRKGDKVEFTVADNIVTKVNAEIVKSYVEGKIKSKRISYNSGEITIINEENREEETYIVPSNVVVKLDDQRVGLDKLELGYFVEINLEGEEVVGVNGLSTTLEDKHLGRITHAGATHLQVTLNDGKQVEINMDNVSIKDQSGNKINKSSLKKGDGILISGDIYGNEIVASEIMRFSK